MTAGSADPRAPVAPPPEGEPWTVLHLVRWSADWLGARGVERPRLDVELLLADALGVDRLRLYLQFDRPLVDGELAAFRARLRRRAAREPVQYILGRTAFRELELRTDGRALIPRPETEELVGAVLDAMKLRAGDQDAPTALEIGTGSGAIALSLAVEGAFRRIVATDLSEAALSLARENAAAVDLPGGVDLEFREGDLFRPVAGGERFDVVVSNPPYVTDGAWEGLQAEVRDWEPRTALTAGADGLAVLAGLVAGAPDVLRPGGLLALEIGAEQGQMLLDMIAADGRYRSQRVMKDLSGRNRCVLAMTVDQG